jgi:hypothetical protein
MENSLIDNLKILDLVRCFNCSTCSSLGTFNSASSNIEANSKMNSNANTSQNNQSSSSPVHLAKENSSNIPGLSSPVNLLTNAGSPAAVLAVSGISATNLLITSSGALGLSQIPGLASASNAIGNQPNINAAFSLNNPLLPSISAGLVNDPYAINPSMLASAKSVENYRNMIRALDFCYNDDSSIRFSIIDSINLCVTVVAYASHAYRANQMLIILDVIIPRFLEFIRAETDRALDNLKYLNYGYTTVDKHTLINFQQEASHLARSELANIQKISVAIKTLVNTSEFLSRNFTGPRMENLNASYKYNSNQKNSSHNRSPSIMPDEDSFRYLSIQY